MEDVFDAAWQAGPAASQGRIEAELGSLVDIHGQSLLDDPEQVRRLLLQACPDAHRHVMALVEAVQADVPNRLHGAKDDEALPPLLHDSVRHLRERAALDDEWASWAVRSWAHALALPTTSLDQRNATRANEAQSAPTPDSAPRLSSPSTGGGPALPDPPPSDQAESAILVAPLFSEQDLQRIASDPRPVPGQAIVLPTHDVAPHEVPPPAPPSAPQVARNPAIGPGSSLAWERDIEPRRRPTWPIAVLVLVVVGVFAWWFAGDLQHWFAKPASAPVTPIVTTDPPTTKAEARVEPGAETPAPVVAPVAIPDASAPTYPVPQASPQARTSPVHKDGKPPAIDRKTTTVDNDAVGPCTPAICGTVVGASELGPGTGTPVYRIVVRMDDRGSRVFTATYRLQDGSRVRAAGSRIVPAGSDGR